MRNRRCDVWSSVSEVYWKDLGLFGCCKQRRRHWQNATAIRCGAFREHEDDSSWVVPKVCFEVDHFCTSGWLELGIAKGPQHCLKERNRLNQAGVGIARDDYWVEDGCDV